MGNPACLFVESAGEHADQVGVLQRAGEDVLRAGGEVLAYAPAGRVACLEPGSVASGMLLARFSMELAELQQASSGLIAQLRSALPAHTEPQVLAVNGLPDQGLPEMMDIPTVASVPVPPKSPRNALMIIRGSVSNQEKIDGYRDVILPMLKERGGYYEIFALQPGEVLPLAGEWNEQIFAVSRWPQADNAHDFWYAERYQQVAIPKRIGFGRFSVHLLEAAD
ncbi:MAG: DUF1330 domain-containing protein [Steroidobacteraceae bacterium]